MAVIPVDFCQANLVFTGVGVPNGAEVTMGFDHSANVGDPDAVASAIGASWDDNIMVLLGDEVTHVATRVKFGPNATGPDGVETVSVTGSGSTADVMPQIAALVQKRTALGGRAGRGRMYIPGITEVMIDPGGMLNPEIRDGIQAGLEEWLDELAVLSLFPVVLHGADSPLTDPTTVTSFQVDGMVATQRRRLRG